MSFFSGFLTGMAKQYNANTAAQMKEEANIRALDYEYGKRAEIERDKSAAAAALAEDEFSNQMFMEAIQQEGAERLERIKGEEQQELEKLKARLEGSGSGVTYTVGTDSAGKAITVTLPNIYEGKSELQRAQNAMTYFETQGAREYQRIKQYNDPTQITDFENRLFGALTFRLAQPDMTYADTDRGGRPVLIDRFDEFPETMRIVMQSPVLQEKLKGLVPDLDRRMKDRLGLPANYNAVTPVEGPNGKTAVAYHNFPDWTREADGTVAPETVDQLTRMETEGNVPLEDFFSYLSLAKDPKAKFEEWKRLDNLYSTKGSSNKRAPYLNPQAKAEVAQSLERQRARDPELAYQYFRFMAANDIFPVEKEIDFSQGESNFMSAEVMKKMYRKDPNAMQDKFIASNRVVRFTEGIFGSLERGAKYGIAGKLQLFAAGAGEQYQEFVQIGGEIINVVAGLEPSKNDADNKIRSRQLNELQGIHSRLQRGDTISETAMLKYYSTLLAYAMAVAVQGGDAAARTVSDQDVQRVANGVAPAGSDRNILSASEIYAVTLAAMHEMKEQAVIYGGYASQDEVQARASYYYEQTYGNRPQNIRDLMRMRLAESNPELYARMGFDSEVGAAAQSSKGRLKADDSINEFYEQSGLGNNQKVEINPVNPTIPGPLGPTQQ